MSCDKQEIHEKKEEAASRSDDSESGKGNKSITNITEERGNVNGR